MRGEKGTRAGVSAPELTEPQNHRFVANSNSAAVHRVWDGSGCQATPRTPHSFAPRIVSSFLSGYLNFKEKARPRMPAKPFGRPKHSCSLRPVSFHSVNRKGEEQLSIQWNRLCKDKGPNLLAAETNYIKYCRATPVLSRMIDEATLQEDLF